MVALGFLALVLLLGRPAEAFDLRDSALVGGSVQVGSSVVPELLVPGVGISWKSSPSKQNTPVRAGLDASLYFLLRQGYPLPAVRPYLEVLLSSGKSAETVLALGLEMVLVTPGGFLELSRRFIIGPNGVLDLGLGLHCLRIPTIDYGSNFWVYEKGGYLPPMWNLHIGVLLPY
jgi:hypothetical protein